MVRVERSFDNKKVLSIDDKVVIMYGEANPNLGNGTHASKGTLFVEEPPSSLEAVFWIKRHTSDPRSWETWDTSFATNSVLIPPSQTRTIDTVALADFTTYRWLVDITDSISKTQSYQMIGRTRGTDVDYSRFAILGEKVFFSISLTSDGTYLTYDITNNEANAITVKHQRQAV